MLTRLQICLCINFHEGGPYHIETSPLICEANQWTGFYMIVISVMKVKEGGLTRYIYGGYSSLIYIFVDICNLSLMKFSVNLKWTGECSVRKKNLFYKKICSYCS